MSYVYLKTKANTGSTTIDVIPLKATTITIATDKTIPAKAIPFSGLATGESTTAALDLGMSSKSITIQGVILPASITKSHAGGTKNFTAHEIAQMIHSGVDSTGLAEHQALDELVFLIPSMVNEDYVDRGQAIDSSVGLGTVSENIPFSFAARGGDNLLDNFQVPLAEDFPTNETSEGLKGFIRQFSSDFSAETVEVTFSMTFEVAMIFP